MRASPSAGQWRSCARFRTVFRSHPTSFLRRVCPAAMETSEPYEELIDGEWLLRLPPRAAHETICLRMYQFMSQVVASLPSTRLLPPRSQVVISDRHQFRPDLALLTSATGKLWLAVEVISQEDHHADTVLKKMAYEELKLPRLWIVDPRYENVEVYHAATYGMTLKETLMVKESLSEPLLPEFVLPVGDLFAAPGGPLGLSTRAF